MNIINTTDDFSGSAAATALEQMRGKKEVAKAVLIGAIVISTSIGLTLNEYNNEEAVFSKSTVLISPAFDVSAVETDRATDELFYQSQVRAK